MRTRHLMAAVGVFLLLVSPGLADEPKPKADKLTPEKALAEAVVRWNKAADGVTAVGPVGKVGFTWDDGRFPHPTFKGGSAEAYGAFAGVLAEFLVAKGNFEFLAENNLFAAPLSYGKAKVDWTFGKLLADLSQPNAHGTHDEATRQALKGYADKAAQLPK